MAKRRKKSPRKNPAAVALGRKGGKARVGKLSKKQLSDQGRKAVIERWKREKGPKYTPPES